MSNLITFQNVAKTDVERAIDSSGVMQIISDKMGRAKFTQSAISLLSNPAIASCTQDTVIGALLKAATFGFEISPELGQCWAIPRNVKVKDADGRDLLDKNGKAVWAKQATFQVGYKGWQELAFRSKSVQCFGFGEVYGKDEFDFEEGTNAYLKHKKSRDFQDRGKREYFYATALLQSGVTIFNTANAIEAEDMRRLSETQYDGGYGTDKVFKQKPHGMWEKYYPQMVWKGLIKTICTKRIHTTTDIVAGIMADDSVTIVHDGQAKEITPHEVHNDNIEQPVMWQLSDDTKMEIDATKTPDALKEVYLRSKREMSRKGLPIEMTTLLVDYCTAHGEKMGFQKTK